MQNALPRCELIDALRKKAKERTDVQFDYMGVLTKLRHRVGAEVRFINQLFPEYTPHDEEYHLSRLFHVADMLIGRVRFDGMLATELFVLACGLYGHDWGMAVSQSEREFIVTGDLPDGVTADDLSVLTDEKVRFAQFLTDRGLDANMVRTTGAPDEDWREYVRQTHALRSAERIRRFFRTSESGVAEAIARVCEGHWLDFEFLHDSKRFPLVFSVLGEPINLAAVATYVRLVDLLDIASDRTPYVIWKFVAPRNQRSRMEWEKHRALQPITCPVYQSGRIIQVDGSTDDHEVFAALEDLRLYCEVQLRGCMDLLARLNDPRHHLDLYHVDWRVVARGFEPVSIRFEFDRERVFELLSSEIYEDDGHVFLRELLQNSIDAIRTRREILRQGGLLPQQFGLVRVEVEDGPGATTRVVWTDNGVGMDRYVVQNYLAIAGRSYYHSDEFLKMGLSLDAISRFGVGILSCFMVADEIEIETYKEPYAPPADVPLRIKIPAVTRQFRIETFPPGTLEVGTRVTVHLQARLWPDETKPLQVTQYLKAVAGFVEFPVLISEGGVTTLILRPNEVLSQSDPRLRGVDIERLQIHYLSLAYPVEEAFLPQDVESARVALREVSYDLQNDLGLSDVEGWISFMVPRDNDVWIERVMAGLDERGVRLHSRTASEVVVRGRERLRPAAPSISASADSRSTKRVYRDGVLVARATIPGRYLGSIHSEVLAEPQHVINLLPRRAPDLLVSRGGFKNERESWYEPIEDALYAKVTDALSDVLESVPPERRFSSFGTFIMSYQLTERALFGGVTDRFPIPVLTSVGRIEFRNWDSLGNVVIVIPEQLSNAGYAAITSATLGIEHDGFSSRWRGEEFLVLPVYATGKWLNFTVANAACRLMLKRQYYLSAIKLATPPEGRFPLMLEVWEKRVMLPERKVSDLIVTAKDDPLRLLPVQRAQVAEKFREFRQFRFIDFPEQTGSVFRSGNLINIRHPVGHLAFRLLSHLVTRETVEASLAGQLRDALRSALETWNIASVVAVDLGELAVKAGLHLEGRPSSLTGRVWHDRGTDLEVRKTGNEFGLPWTLPTGRSKR
jgi:hypothetical protein